MPDSYSFSSQGFTEKDADLERIIFGAPEYLKDGLLPLTEYLGPSPWSERMIAITDDVWAHASVEAEFGSLPSLDVEINGEQLQVLSRLYWMTGEGKYLEWAIRISIVISPSLKRLIQFPETGQASDPGGAGVVGKYLAP